MSCHRDFALWRPVFQVSCIDETSDRLSRNLLSIGHRACMFGCGSVDSGLVGHSNEWLNASLTSGGLDFEGLLANIGFATGSLAIYLRVYSLG